MIPYSVILLVRFLENDMLLSEIEIKRIAKLARIALDEKALEQFQENLNRIFELIEKIQGVDTDNIQPMAYPQDIYLTPREDKATPTPPKEVFLVSAPQSDAEFFLVPKAID